MFLWQLHVAIHVFFPISRDAIIICVIDTLMSILAGFTVFASLGILAHQLETDIENVVTSSE